MTDCENSNDLINDLSTYLTDQVKTLSTNPDAELDNYTNSQINDSIKVYSLIEIAVSTIQRDEWLIFKEIRKELLKYKHISNHDTNSDANCYIYYFKPKDFKYDFYYWIAKIILSKSFGFYSDYIRTETDFEYFTDKLRFQELLKPYAKFPLNLYPTKSYPSNNAHDEAVRLNKNIIFLQHNGVFALYILC